MPADPQSPAPPVPAYRVRGRGQRHDEVCQRCGSRDWFVSSFRDDGETPREFCCAGCQHRWLDAGWLVALRPAASAFADLLVEANQAVVEGVRNRMLYYQAAGRPGEAQAVQQWLHAPA